MSYQCKLIAFELGGTQLPTLSALAMRVEAGGIITPEEWRLAGLPMAKKKIGKTEVKEIINKFVTLTAPQLFDLLTISPRNCRHQGAINDLAFDPLGEILAFCTSDGCVALINLKRAFALSTAENFGQAICYAPFFPAGEEYGVSKITFSPDGKKFAVGTKNGSIDVSCYKLLANEIIELDVTARFNANRGQKEHGIAGLAFSQDGQHLVIGLDDLTVKIVDLTELARNFTLYSGYSDGTNRQWYNPVAISPDGKYLVTQSRTGNGLYDHLGVAILDLQKTIEEGKAVVLASFDYGLELCDLKFNRTGNQLAVCLRNIETNKGKVKLLDWSKLVENNFQEIEGNAQKIDFDSLPKGVGISPNGQRLAVGGNEGYLTVANLLGVELSMPPVLTNQFMGLDGTTNRVHTTMFHPKVNTIFAAGTENGEVKVYKVE